MVGRGLRSWAKGTKAMMGSATVRAAAFVVAMGATAASAAEFGAIAYSNTTGSYGYSHNYATRGQAERVAQANCLAYARDCRVIVYFYNACAALAVGNSFGYGYGYAPGPKQSRSIALANCRVNDRGCQVVRTVCSR